MTFWFVVAFVTGFAAGYFAEELVATARAIAAFMTGRMGH